MRKILVVDELKKYIEGQESILNRTNVALFSAATAEDVLEIHRREHMDLIIADIEMPEMGGEELCRRIREDEDMKKVYIVRICSGRKGDLLRCEDCGANTYVTRPVDLPEIAERVSRLLDIPERSAMRVLVKISVHGNFRSEPFFCTSRDISVSGILIESDKTLARGDKIGCSFYLPDSERISVEGKIVRVARGETNTYNYGVKFTQVSDGAQAAIERFVRKRREDRHQGTACF